MTDEEMRRAAERLDEMGARLKARLKGEWPIEAKTGCYPLVGKDGRTYIGEWHTDGRVVLYAGWWDHPGDVIKGQHEIGLDVGLTIRNNAAEVAANLEATSSSREGE